MNKYLFEYKRVSSTDQLAGSGMALQTLDTDLRTHLCKQYDLTPYNEVFDDAGVSAYSKSASERPAFNRMLQILDQPDVSHESVVVLYNWDRLSRQDIHAAMATLMQITSKVRLYIMSENRLFDKADPDLMVSLMMALVGLARAGDESKAKSQRTRGAALKKVREHNEGKRSANGNAIFNSHGSIAWWLDSTDGEIKLHEYYAPICKEIINKFISGMGNVKILDWLNTNYKPPAKRTEWNYNQLVKLHTHKSLIGEYTLTIGDVKYVLEEYVPRLIDDSTYWQFVATKKRRTHTRSSNDRKYLLTGMGITKCAFCGNGVTTALNHGKDRLRCLSSVHRKGECAGFNVTGEHIYDAIFDVIGKLVWTPPVHIVNNAEGIKANLVQLKEQMNQVEQDYISNPSSVLARVLGNLEVSVNNKQQELEEEQLKHANEDDYIITDIPDDIDGKRELIRRSFESILILKMGRSEMVVALKSKRSFNVFIYIKLGKVIKSGSIYTEYEDQLKLFQPNELALFVQSNVFNDWVDSKYDCIDIPPDTL